MGNINHLAHKKVDLHSLQQKCTFGQDNTGPFFCFCEAALAPHFVKKMSRELFKIVKKMIRELSKIMKIRVGTT